MTDFDRAGRMNRLDLLLSDLGANERLAFLADYLYNRVYRNPDFTRQYVQEQITAIENFREMFV